MADLELQKKKTSIWPWILGALALIALIWIAAEMMGDDDDDFDDEALVTAPAAVDVDPIEPVSAVPQDVQAFRTQCGSASTMRDEMAVDHSYEADCLNRLAAAMNATITRDTVSGQALAARLNTLEQSAQQLTQNPQSTEHAGEMEQAMTEAAAIIEQVAETRSDIGSELRQHVSALESSIEEFGRTDVLLDQKRAVAQYFDHAAEALELMNRNLGMSS